MSIIIDTSIVIAVVTNEPSKQKLIKVTKNKELIAPTSLHWEVGNAFSAMIKRKIDSKKLTKALESYNEIQIRLVQVDLEDTLEICKKYKLYAYDAYFLIAAKKFRKKLLTIDKGLLEAAKKMNINLLEI